jgi:hypothetical protein
MPAKAFDRIQGRVITGKKLESAAYSEAVLRMPKKPAIELVDSRTLGLHSLFSLLTTLGASFAAALWTAFATGEENRWILAAALMFTVMSFVFLLLAIGAYCRMRSKRHNIEVPLSDIGDIGDVSRFVRQIYLTHTQGSDSTGGSVRRFP